MSISNIYTNNDQIVELCKTFRHAVEKSEEYRKKYTNSGVIPMLGGMGATIALIHGAVIDPSGIMLGLAGIVAAACTVLGVSSSKEYKIFQDYEVAETQLATEFWDVVYYTTDNQEIKFLMDQIENMKYQLRIYADAYDVDCSLPDSIEERRYRGLSHQLRSARKELTQLIMADEDLHSIIQDTLGDIEKETLDGLIAYDDHEIPASAPEETRHGKYRIQPRSYSRLYPEV